MQPALVSIDDGVQQMVSVVVTDRQGLAASTTLLLTIEALPASIQQFARDMFIEDADDDPALVNAIEFAQDADADDFGDLLVELSRPGVELPDVRPRTPHEPFSL